MPTDGFTIRAADCCSLIKRRSDAGLSHRCHLRQLPEHHASTLHDARLYSTPLESMADFEHDMGFRESRGGRSLWDQSLESTQGIANGIHVKTTRVSSEDSHPSRNPGRVTISALMRTKMEIERQSRDPAVSEQEMPEKERQAKAERLQACVCLLLEKNQTLRMALVAERVSGQTISC
jgi:hypothetical protein